MRYQTILHGLILMLVLAAAAAGVFYRTEGERIHHTTIRGEQATIQGHGLYRYDPVEVADEGIVWDAINLFVGLPLFAVAILLTARHRLRGRLLLGGLLFYFFYVYLMYATMVAFNSLFLIYVAIFALSLIAFLLNLREIDVAGLPAHISERFPRRLLAGYAMAMGVMILLLWLRLIISIMGTGRFPPQFAGMVTLPTQALDLGLIVPLMTSTAILLWRRSPSGYLLASIGVSFGLLLCLVLPAWIIVPLIRRGTLDAVEAVPFLAGSVAGLFLAWMFFRNINERAGTSVAGPDR
ncbi:MAG: hypothetical protein ABI876_13555 [Bacteroidota bacterium]